MSSSLCVHYFLSGYITAHEMHSVLHATQHQRFTVANSVSQAESSDDKELREKITQEVKENATVSIHYLFHTLIHLTRSSTWPSHHLILHDMLLLTLTFFSLCLLVFSDLYMYP